MVMESTQSQIVKLLSLTNKIISSNQITMYLTRQFLALIPYHKFKLESVSVEVNNICNLKCKLCPVQGLTRQKGSIKFNDFKIIVDKLKKSGVKHIDLMMSGEMTLNPHLFDMIRYVHKIGLTVFVATNGTSPKTKELIEAEPDGIEFAMDGISKETEEYYRVNSNFDKVSKHLQELCTYRDKLKKKTKIIWQFIVMRHNEHEVKDAIKLAKKLGVNQISFKPLSLVEGFSEEDKRTLAEKWLPRKWSHSRYDKKIDVNKPLLCPAIFGPMILYNGDVALCCYDINGKYVAGNILKEESFEKIWKSKRFRNLRKNVIKNELPICKKCSMGLGGSKIYTF